MFYKLLAVLSRDFPGIYSIGSKLEVAIGPIFSLLGPKMWEELRCIGIKWLLFYKGQD